MSDRPQLEWKSDTSLISPPPPAPPPFAGARNYVDKVSVSCLPQSGQSFLLNVSAKFTWSNFFSRPRVNLTAVVTSQDDPSFVKYKHLQIEGGLLPIDRGRLHVSGTLADVANQQFTYAKAQQSAFFLSVIPIGPWRSEDLVTNVLFR